MSHALELRMILSYLIFYNFRNTFIYLFIYFVLLGLLVLLVYFYFVRFVYSLLSTTPDSNKVGDWEGDGRG